ncbi:MAG: FtsB family cell division protein [Bacillota bacterium]
MKNNTTNKIIFYRILPLVLLVIIGLLTYQLVSNQLQIAEMEREMEEVEQEIEVAEERKLELQRELELLDDPDYIERLAREKFGLVKPGEELIIPVEE